MKLYDVPRHTQVRILATNEVLLFEHIDGMYSVCKYPDGHVVHHAAWTEVEIVEES
jgi:hypothetical protein